tara:strand:+ start:582 stop:1175 length:594 start_codon:yes stop_codon:yes gene_type:complete
MNFIICASLYGGSVGIALALIARLARTLRFEQAEHLPLEFGSFVAASGFISGGLVAFFTMWIARDGLSYKYSWVRFLLVIIGFGIFTGFIRGILNPISVSAFDLYKGFLTFKEFFDLVASHLFRFYLNGMVEAAFTIFTGLLGGAIFSTGCLIIWFSLRLRTPITRYTTALSVTLILSLSVVLISSMGPADLLSKLD